MKTETKIKVFAAATATVFWMVVLDYPVYIALLLLLVYFVQLFAAIIRTLGYLFNRKRMSTAIKIYWLSNLIYISGYLILFAAKPYLPDVLNPLLYRAYFPCLLLILVWYFISIYFTTNKRTHV